MNRKRLEDEMLKMGFFVSHKGFLYVADAVEQMANSDFGIRGMKLYEAVAKKRDTSASRAERCIRAAIHRMYERANPIPVELTPDATNGVLPNMEFICRLAMLAKGWTDAENQ